jgi:hypothetical protein
MENKEELKNKIGILSEEYTILSKERDDLCQDPISNGDKIEKIEKLMTSKYDEIIVVKHKLDASIDNKPTITESIINGFQNVDMKFLVNTFAAGITQYQVNIGSDILDENSIQSSIYSNNQQVHEFQVQSTESFHEHSYKSALDLKNESENLQNNDDLKDGLGLSKVDLNKLLSDYKDDCYSEALSADSNAQAKENACSILCQKLEKQSDRESMISNGTEIGQSFEEKAKDLIKEQYGQEGVEKFEKVTQNVFALTFTNNIQNNHELSR